jgi:hypothetical protein
LLKQELKNNEAQKDIILSSLTRTAIKSKIETLKSVSKVFSEVEQDVINTMLKDFAL